MKIKKTLALIMVAALTVGTMAGCSQETLNYTKELSNTAKWEATTSNVEGKINVDATGMTEEITFTSTGYTANNKSYAEMKFNDPSGNFNIPEIKVYSDGTTSYINKSFYEGLYKLSGQAIPEKLANIEEEYIGIDASATGLDVNQLKALTTDPDAIVLLGKLVFGDNDINIPFVQNGREYTINLDTDQAVDLSGKAIKVVSNNFDKINSLFKLGLPTEEITQIQTAVNDSSFDSGLTSMKTALAGSTITSKEVFADDSYNSEINVDLQVKDFGQISLEMNSTSTKSEVDSVTFPTSIIKFSAEEFNKISAPTIEETANTVAQ